MCACRLWTLKTQRGKPDKSNIHKPKGNMPPVESRQKPQKDDSAPILPRPVVVVPTRVFVELTYYEGDQAALLGQLEFELNVEKCPKASENFRALCVGVPVADKKVTKTVGYKGTGVVRIRDFMFQAGDISGKEDHSGQDSSFGPGVKFEDEALLGHATKTNKAGALGYANSGPNTNASQFFVTLGPAPWLDKHYVIFGELVSGDDVLQKVAEIRRYTDARGFLPPKGGHTIVISNCGTVSTTTAGPDPSSPQRALSPPHAIPEKGKITTPRK